jgi:AcrR family transcriptional regulator
MARISKEHNVRKKEIADAAQALFYQQGFSKTSVNLIIEKVGISKGTFYHYFKSKEDLLDSIMQDFTKQILEKLEPVVNDKNLNAIEKLNKVYIISGMYKVENFQLMSTLLKIFLDDSNLLLRNKMKLESIEKTIPIFTQILKQGKSEGVFDIELPKETAEMILHFGNSLSDITGKFFLEANENPENINKLVTHFEIYRTSVERILGAPKNSITVMDGNFVKLLTENKYEN